MSSSLKRWGAPLTGYHRPPRDHTHTGSRDASSMPEAPAQDSVFTPPARADMFPAVDGAVLRELGIGATAVSLSRGASYEDYVPTKLVVPTEIVGPPDHLTIMYYTAPMIQGEQ